MKKFNVSITCMAVYSGVIEVPDDATFEDALEIARNELPNIPLGELDYIPDSDELDEENCSFEDDEGDKSCGSTYENVINQWCAFDTVMEENGYRVDVVDEEVLAEEREQMGRVYSSLGSTAYKDDVWSVYIKARIQSNYGGMVVNVYDRGGNQILSGRHLGSYTFPNDWTEFETRNQLSAILERFGKYQTGNRVPETEY